MTNSLDAVRLYVPLMKETNITWEEIKRTPRWELEGILAACHEYNLLHSMDGYEAKDIGDLAKNKPSIRQDWGRYMAQKRKYELLSNDGSGEESVDSAVAELKSQMG
tara:strand:- start:6818 stop:7138 length:321 start_codon:yes stop_codon:yes gene_type:complete